MGVSEFARRGSQHPAIQCARLHVVPKALARQFIERDRSRVRDRSAKPVAIQHLETTHFPAAPFSHVAQKPDRDAGEAQIEINKIGRASSVDIAALCYDRAISPPLFRDRIDL
ncbi:MAG: hypothetical protein DME97_12600 [Verrucomicrobia bacterium]|nr:MAG: hypothetical protein DME97_12600 [Verrucomicrobiota bacterium]